MYCKVSKNTNINSNSKAKTRILWSLSQSEFGAQSASNRIRSVEKIARPNLRAILICYNQFERIIIVPDKNESTEFLNQRITEIVNLFLLFSYNSEEEFQKNKKRNGKRGAFEE